MKVALLTLVLGAIGCGSVAATDASSPAPSGGDPSRPPADAPATTTPSTKDDVPLFYGTIEVGANKRDAADDVRAHVDVREYGVLQPGASIALGPGEVLTINDVPLTLGIQEDGMPTYDAPHVPEAADGKYQFRWVRQNKTVFFHPVSVPRITVSVPATLKAEIPFDVTVQPVREFAGLTWNTDSACAKRRLGEGFEHADKENILTLLESPCDADLAFTSQTNWSVALLASETSTPTAEDYGHVSIVGRSLAWQRVSVVP